MSGLPPFQRFADEHRTHVWRFLVAAVGPVEADDCFQETFLAALRAYPSLRHGENLRSWVMTIAANKAVDAGRSRRRRPVAVGVQELVGAPAEVRQDGYVAVRGELWRARSVDGTPLRPGDRVRVEKVDGLVLGVRSA